MKLPRITVQDISPVFTGSEIPPKPRRTGQRGIIGSKMTLTRLSKKADFQRLFKRGNRVRNDYFQLIFQTNPIKTEIRLAIIIKNSLVAKATKRNYLRRRIREIFRQNDFRQPSLGADIIISLMKFPPKKWPFAGISASVTDLLQKARLINKNDN